jgi:hypothetical protein
MWNLVTTGGRLGIASFRPVLMATKIRANHRIA